VFEKRKDKNNENSLKIKISQHTQKKESMKFSKWT
jgi:hypothetical protein